MVSFKNKRIIIVGGAGFVGSNLIHHLIQRECNSIWIIDNLLSSERENIPDDSRIHFTEGSIADDNILTKITDSYDFIFHLATYHGNQSSIHDPIADHDNNLYTTLKLFNYIKNYKNIKKIVYSAAGCATAEKTFNNAIATTEDAPISLRQDSPYSISKLVGEFYAVYFHSQNGLPVVRARFQNVYGPGEILGAGQWRGTPATIWRNVTPTFIYKALKSELLPVENKGLATRDFIFVDDICKGLIACALKGKSGDVYNIASGKEISIIQLANLINELTKNSAGIKLIPQREWDHSGRRFGSTQKTEQKLGFKSQTDFEEGLKKTIEWTKENFSMIEKNVKKHWHRL